MLEVWKGEMACLSVTMVDFLCVAGLFMLAENGILSQVVTAMLMMSMQNTTLLNNCWPNLCVGHEWQSLTYASQPDVRIITTIRCVQHVKRRNTLQ